MPQQRFSRQPDVAGKLRVSFKSFPPKTDAMEARLWETVQRLEPLTPSFVSVTYGAGGSTRERTARTVRRILDETSLTPAAHMTCVDASREDVDQVVGEFVDMGVKRFVALRGDPSAGVGAAYRPHPDGYANGAELVGAMKRQGDFDISVSAYPEKHPESPDFATDIDMFNPRSTTGRRAPSPSSSSTTITMSAMSSVRGARASTFPSCRASCRCTISHRLPISPGGVAPVFPAGWPNVSRGWKTSRRFMRLWLRPSLPSRCSISWNAGSMISTSTR